MDDRTLRPADSGVDAMKNKLAAIGSKIITIGSWVIIAILLGVLGLATYGLYLLGWISMLILASVFLPIVAFLALYNMHEKRSRVIETYTPAPALAIEGQVLEPECVDIYTWTVRKAPSGNFAALPIDRNGKPYWNMAIGFNEDSDEPWGIANEKRAELGWIH